VAKQLITGTESTMCLVVSHISTTETATVSVTGQAVVPQSGIVSNAIIYFKVVYERLRWL